MQGLSLCLLQDDLAVFIGIHHMDRANCFHIVLKIKIKQRVNLDKGHLLYNNKNYFCFIDKNSKMIYNHY